MGHEIHLEEKYSNIKDNVQVLGFVAATEEECRTYFATRVLSKLVESDGTEELRQHLLELGSTGFSLDGLLEQIQPSPKAKDWEIGEACSSEGSLRLRRGRGVRLST